MTIEDIKTKYGEPKDGFILCEKCPLPRPCEFDNNCSGYIDAYQRILDFFESNNTSKNLVNHPKHYNREGSMECIDEMELIFGKEAVMSFCLCNAWKYRTRAMDKDGLNDLKKSDWYINKYKELKELYYGTDNQ